MPYKASAQTIKETAKATIKAELSRLIHADKAWTPASLHDALADKGITIRPQLVSTILDELVADGTLVSVP